MTNRNETQVVRSKNITMGGNNKVSIQTMLKGSFVKYNACYINELKVRGCDILRFSIKGEYDEDALKTFIKTSPLPLVLDVKSDITPVILAVDAGIDAFRVNPTLLSKSDLKKAFILARDNSCIVRIGTNDGSTHGKNALELITEAINTAESIGFTNIVTSLKASDEKETIKKNRELASLTKYPIHLGLTEAGSAVTSAVRSTLVLSNLLNEGIGSTIRYSMAGGEKKEVEAASELLCCLKLKKPYLRLVVCPSCARCTFLTEDFLKTIEDDLYSLAYYNKRYISVAIMGCSLNGIGEAKNADFGVSGDGITAVIFSKGQIVEKCSVKNVKNALISVIKASF